MLNVLQRHYADKLHIIWHRETATALLAYYYSLSKHLKLKIILR